MSKEGNELKLLGRLARYTGILLSQCLINREYIYFWLIATCLHIVALEAVRPWCWILIGGINLLVGLAAIATCVRPIDKAFESLGFDYKHYGLPTWIVRGKYPLTQEVIRIRAAGYAASDFEKYVPQLSSRLKKTIEGIRKPSDRIPEIEISFKKAALPEKLPYESMPLNTLAQGEFIVGQGAEGLIKLALRQMVHMLVAGQTGSGKTQFIRQFIATILARTWGSYVCLIDMKGGIDFQPFLNAPNFEMVTDYESAEILLDRLIALYEKRRDFILAKKKSHWSEFSYKDLEKEPSLKGKPIGPIVLVVDELAELSKKATAKASKSELQEKIATLARLSRFTGIHLLLGTQRPDKSTLDMQSKDNLPTRVCFSVPSVTASTLVIGDMSASTLGQHPGRAIYQHGPNKVIQTPLITNAKLDEMIEAHAEKYRQLGFNRGIFSSSPDGPEKSSGKAEFK